MIIEKVSGNAVLINSYHSKAFDGVKHGFLDAVWSAAGFGLNFRSWICQTPGLEDVIHSTWTWR